MSDGSTAVCLVSQRVVHWAATMAGCWAERWAASTVQHWVGHWGVMTAALSDGLTADDLDSLLAVPKDVHWAVLTVLPKAACLDFLMADSTVCNLVVRMELSLVGTKAAPTEEMWVDYLVWRTAE